MKKLLTGTAIGLLMGLTPALAETDMPADQSQNPPAMQDQAVPQLPESTPEMAPSDPSGTSDPAAPIPGQSSEMSPQTSPSHGDPMPSVSEAPKDILPNEDAKSDSASLDQPRFLTQQESDELLASNLIGQPVYNAKNEAIGDINDLVTDKDGKISAVLIGAGGFLGLGEKDVAVSYDDLKFVRDEDNNVKIISDMTSETLASAPDYERLSEQAVTVGEMSNPDASSSDEAPVTQE
ncbi:MAG: PRC-barrel domain-containing protein [Hyphomicrobiales bacterium]